MIIALHTVYLVMLISQATSALVLALLAWSDRRSNGLTRLAAACGLHVGAILLVPMWRGTHHWLPEAFSAAILPLMFFLIHTGLARFLGHRERTPRPARIAVLVAILVPPLISPWSMFWSIQIAPIGTLFIIVQTIRMLLKTEPPVLRFPTRATAAILFLIAVIFVLRFPLEAFAPQSTLFLLSREITVTAITLLAFSFLAVYLAESQRLLTRETRLDPLTGLMNRRAMEEQAALQVRHAQRNDRSLSLLMMDLDGFKLLNDTWGHFNGDRALCAVGYVLQSAAKNSGNTVARLGGEEFAMLLPDHSLDNAESIAERLRTAIAALSLAEGADRISFTVSIGVAAWHSGETSWTDMLQRADIALYRAKREGRNRVALCDHPRNLFPSADRYGRTRRSNRSESSVLLSDSEPFGDA